MSRVLWVRGALLVLSFALSAVVVVAGLQVVGACRPEAPLFDHAVLMADMLHQPPHLFRGHNEHLPVVPRLVFWLEALLTDGEPRLPVSLALSALVAGSMVASRAWLSPWRLAGAGVLLAAVLRPSLSWSVSWATNIQYPLAFFGAAVAFWGVQRLSLGWTLAGGVWAALSSAEGLLVLPIAAVWAVGRGQRGKALGMAACSVLLGVVTTSGGTSGLRPPASWSDWVTLADFAAALVAYPWSLRLWSATAGVLLLGAGILFVRHRQADPVLGLLAVYGLGFAALVLAGRWWLPSVHHRYALGATLAVAGAVLAVSMGSGPEHRVPKRDRWVSAGLAMGLGALLVAEVAGLTIPISAACRAGPPPGTAFWHGRSEDGSDAHPGFPDEIARELRAHLWRAGLYRPPVTAE